MDHSDNTCALTAADVAEEHRTRASFLDLPLEVLEYILPNLPPQSILSLALASKSFHYLLFPPAASSSAKHTLRPWRHLNLGESYASPLPLKKASQKSSLPQSPPPTSNPAFVFDPDTILQRSHILSNVRTLILDGLPSVTTPFLETLFQSGDHPGNLSSSHRIQILSIRACPNLDDMPLAISVLRAQEFPSSLRGIYYFSDPEMDFVAPATGGADVFVTPKMGRTLNSAKRRSSDPARGGWWVETMKLLKGKVAFDAEVCRGKAHFQYDDEAGEWIERDPIVASMRLTKGCAGCGTHPESEDYHCHVGQTRGNGYGNGDCSEVMFPPAPVYSSSLASAKSDKHLWRGGRVTLRCTECLGKRYCRGCGKWWCTPCAERPMQLQNTEQPSLTEGALERRQVVARDCFECGFLCGECTSLSARECVNCSECYCVLHDEQANLHNCEWCTLSTSHRRRGSISRVAPSRRSSISIASASVTTSTIITTSPNEIDTALSSIAILTDPHTTYSISSSASTSPPASPYLGPIPQPVILLSSRLPAPATAAPYSAKPRQKSFSGVPEHVTGPPSSPILRAMSGKGEVHRGAGMRLRAMMGGLGTGLLGANGGGGGSSVHVGPAERAEVDRRMRWLGRV
ncbi:hypothetical protein EV426DRAFT_701778 [Tirmania nivea]|nr:hypothetical protein EV426DRAFT_701778 [Tirmania nivea]